jgi:hypothetical protein
LSTRQFDVRAAVSLRLIPAQSRSLPAVSFSHLDGVKSGRLDLAWLGGDIRVGGHSDVRRQCRLPPRGLEVGDHQEMDKAARPLDDLRAHRRQQGAIDRYGRLPRSGQSPTAPGAGSTSPSDVCWRFEGSECRFGKGPAVRQCDSLLPEVHDQLAPLVA